jgi:hypothetical protein
MEQPKFSLVNEMMKELLSQYAGAIVKALTDEKICDQAKAISIITNVAEKFDAEVTLIKKVPKQKCSNCDDSVSKHSKSHLYCYKCAKAKDDIAEERTCIAPSKNTKGGKCGRKAYGIDYCSIHKKWGEANDKGKICKYLITKGEHKGKECKAIIADNSDEEYCMKHSRKGKCKGTNKGGNPCQFNASPGEEYCQNHLKKKPSKKNIDDAPEEEEVEIEKKDKHHHKKQKKED